MRRREIGGGVEGWVEERERGEKRDGRRRREREREREREMGGGGERWEDE